MQLYFVLDIITLWSVMELLECCCIDFTLRGEDLYIYEPKTDKVWEESVSNNCKSISVC
jgi:hypothetical protein